jgi:hypothetical protein
VVITNAGNQEGGNISDIASLLPPEALNPQAGTSRHRPVSQHVLNNLKRVVLTDQSAELFDAQVSLFDDRDMSNDLTVSPARIQCNAIPGEFGSIINDASRSKAAAALVICSPRTIKGGLSSNTLNEIAILRRHRIPFVAYVEREMGLHLFKRHWLVKMPE